MRRPRRRTIVAALLGLVVIWAAAAGWLLLDARSSVQDGRASLEAARRGATPSSLLDPATGNRLDRSAGRFADARSRLRSPVLTPLRVLPVVGRQVRAADRVVSVAGIATASARRAVDDLQALRDRDLAAGPDRLAALDELSSIVGRTRDDLVAANTGSADALIGPLGEAVAGLEQERVDNVASLGRVQGVIGAVRAMLAGPDPYLLLGANNAEMRAGSGMFLSAASLGFADGRLRMGDVRATESLVLPEGSVAVSSDLAANWGWLDVGRDFRSMGVTADFPQTGPVAAANWAQVPGGGPVAGVIVMDVDAVRGLLGVVGPVEVDGVSYSSDTIRGELLRQQYARFGDDRDGRRDQIGEVAKAVFDRIERGEFELDTLASALIDASARRNLLVWSADPATQQAWADAGIDGRLRDDSMSVALVNRGAEKLDSYLDTAATLDTAGTPATGIEITLTYRITNGAPASGPAYVIGPNIEGMVAGEHRGIVAVNLPAGSTDVVMAGTTPVLSGTDGETLVTAGSIELERGASTEVTVTARLPVGMDAVSIEPAARIGRTRWTVDGRTFDTDRRRTVSVGH